MLRVVSVLSHSEHLAGTAGCGLKVDRSMGPVSILSHSGHLAGMAGFGLDVDRSRPPICVTSCAAL